MLWLMFGYLRVVFCVGLCFGIVLRAIFLLPTYICSSFSASSSFPEKHKAPAHCVFATTGALFILFCFPFVQMAQRKNMHSIYCNNTCFHDMYSNDYTFLLASSSFISTRTNKLFYFIFSSSFLLYPSNQNLSIPFSIFWNIFYEQILYPIFNNFIKYIRNYQGMRKSSYPDLIKHIKSRN